MGVQVFAWVDKNQASLKYVGNNTVATSLCKSLYLCLHVFILPVFVLAF